MSIISSIKGFFRARDELSLSNIRKEKWALFLIFPLSIFLNEFRYFNLDIQFLNFESKEWMLYSFALGWLVLAFIPKRLIIPFHQIMAVCCAVLLPFQFLLTNDIARLSVFMAFQLTSGSCMACAFAVFCFKLNNVEKLIGMMMINFYYGLYHTFFWAYPVVQEIYQTWGGVIIMAVYLVVSFFLNKKTEKPEFEFENEKQLNGIAKNTPVKTVIGLHIVFHIILRMITYVEFADHISFSLPYGFGEFAAVLMLFLIMLISNKNALYIWLLFLVFSFIGITIVNFDFKAAHFTGSLFYGIGDGLGYMIIYYLCAAAIKRSRSIKMYKLFCVVLFIEWFLISGIFSQFFDKFEDLSHYIALTVVLVLSLICFLILPYLHKKLFETDWTDGLYLKDIPEYTQGLAETEAVNKKEHLDLSEREHEIFTMLVKGMSPKEIGYTLKLGISTVYFHRSNLYRKLEVSNISELITKYNASKSSYL